MPAILVTPAAEEPVTLVDAKVHLRVDSNDDDVSIAALIAAARAHVENWTGQQLVTATWRYEARAWGARIKLPRPPLQAVSSVTYLDTLGARQTLSPSLYVVDAVRQPGTIEPAYAQAWPVARCEARSIQVTYTAGFGAASAVPRSIAQAILLLVGHWFANREAVIPGASAAAVLPMGVEPLLWPYRMVEVH